MPRIPDTEIERLKNEVSVERLVEVSGIELKRGGKDMLGRCPFHEFLQAHHCGLQLQAGAVDATRAGGLATQG